MTSLFQPFLFSHLAQPWFLLLWVGVAALLVAEWTAHAPGVMTVSTGETLAGLAPRRRFRRRVPALLRALGLALLVVALARPLQGFQAHKERAKVIDIMLCVDVSGSMRAMDFMLDGQYASRLEVTKKVLTDFIDSRKDKVEDRYGLDRLGLVLFGGYAWTQCPLTLDYGVLQRELDHAHIDDDPRKQRTAIGSAIGLAVSRLRKTEAKTKVIILLTDGMNNAGQLDPITAAQLAKDYNIRVYTVGAGSRKEALVPEQTLFGTRMQLVNAPIDESTLERIATLTGAKYYRATDTGTFEKAYSEISRLETTEVEIGAQYDFQEGFVSYAVLGTLALLVGVFSRRVWFDPIP